MWRVFLPAYAALALAAPTLAETYVVNPEGTGDFPTIQAAIDAVVDGDIIELTDGTFTGDGNRDIGYHGKAIAVQSQGGDPQMCVIDCQGGGETHGGFYFSWDEGPDSRLEGVTVSHAFDWPAIHCANAAPTITNCVLSDNVFTDGLGGALFCDGASPSISQCIFISNRAWIGGAVFCSASLPVFSQCTFAFNEAMTGGALYCEGYETDGPSLVSCTIYGNSSGIHGAYYSPQVTLTNTIIAFNAGDAIYCDGSSFTLVCCDLYGNEGTNWEAFCIADQYGLEGNISEDPLLCDPGGGDLTLEDCSPCAPFTPPNPECDLIGAWPVGCGGTPTTRSTWGGVKALFRE